MEFDYQDLTYEWNGTNISILEGDYFKKKMEDVRDESGYEAKRTASKLIFRKCDDICYEQRYNMDTFDDLKKFKEKMCKQLAKFLVKNGLDYFEAEPRTSRNGRKYVENQDIYDNTISDNFVVVNRKEIIKNCILQRLQSRLISKYQMPINELSQSPYASEIRDEIEKTELIADMFSSWNTNSTKNVKLNYNNLINLENRPYSDFLDIIKANKELKEIKDFNEHWEKSRKIDEMFENLAFNRVKTTSDGPEL